MLKSIVATIDSIQSLQELITVLDEEERAKYTSILKKMKLPMTEIIKYATWSEACYTRNCIEENEDFELVLICWQKDQKTAIHDHGGEECWVYVIEGDYVENIYEKNDNGELIVVKSKEMKPGDVTYMIDFMGFHNIENISDKKSMTLHLYAKPIKNCNVYDSENGSFTRKKLFYNTYQKLLNKN